MDNLEKVEEKIKYKIKVIKQLSWASIVLGWIFGLPAFISFLVVGILILANTIFVVSETNGEVNPGVNGLLGLGIELIIFSAFILIFILTLRTILLSLTLKQINKVESNYLYKDHILILVVIGVVFATHIIGWAIGALWIFTDQDRTRWRQLSEPNSTT